MIAEASVKQVNINGEDFFEIINSDALRPFFMSIVSDANHWLFIASNGGLTAGRKNAEYALFPYYTDDKITESAEITGSKTIIRVKSGNGYQLWEPFSERLEGLYNTQVNLYKNVHGNKVLFEEINHDLGLTFQYSWTTCIHYGFVKTSRLINHMGKVVDLEVIDGIQNIMPYGVPSALQSASSNLVDAYKKSELETDLGLGIFALSAIIIDKAEPSEALKANIAWSVGFEQPSYILDAAQLKVFRKGLPLVEQTEVKGEKGAFFVHTGLSLAPDEKKEWTIVADVNKSHAAIADISQALLDKDALAIAVKEDVKTSTQRLVALTAAADGMQKTADHLKDARHFSNTLFNIMRGGIFDQNYQIEKSDFLSYLAKANKHVLERVAESFSGLSETFNESHLKEMARKSHDPDFVRLALEYMPLKFSRRHGDPSRPWNKFSINTHSEVDGSKILDYEGNWRDIFQNWEALALSYPDFVESMIHKFLNATTFDGYNPYRVTKGGFDWETIEPDDPWSYIGYWGDHQIIYLLKFLEFIESYTPGKISEYFDQEIFAYANVPYRIKSFEDIIKNPKDTIEFDVDADHLIREERDKMGADGALLKGVDGQIYHVNLTEKILATLLAKMSNFIPEAGIWMNTQRPEWNDANNALVGNGVSMVTLYYLRRFLAFFKDVFERTTHKEVAVSQEVVRVLRRSASILDAHASLLKGRISDKDRRAVLQGLGEPASDFRLHIYDHGFSGEKAPVSMLELISFVDSCLQYLDHSIDANARVDQLYHAYNLMTAEEDGAVSISYLSEMLEGQVAVLSSGYLSSKDALSVLDALKESRLFRPDQYSYILYPNKDLGRFLNKNNIPVSSVESSALLTKLVSDGNRSVLEKAVDGKLHFNGNFRNANDLMQQLDALRETDYAALVEQDQKYILQLFEEVFNHKAFTGRSGTFFGYEGLGSIYWHMVSKLLLAVQEVCIKAFKEQEDDVTIGRLLEHFYEINEGIGVHKSPELYGAFPTDPYSHTPAGKGAQQPGMTGQVKEDILARFGELGVFVRSGQLVFDLCLLRQAEFASEPSDFKYVDVNQTPGSIRMPANALGFTYCQVPVIYQIADQKAITVIYHNGTDQQIHGWVLDEVISKDVFERTGSVKQIIVHIPAMNLR